MTNNIYIEKRVVYIILINNLFYFVPSVWKKKKHFRLFKKEQDRKIKLRKTWLNRSFVPVSFLQASTIKLVNLI